jgi:hypothetical protein
MDGLNLPWLVEQSVTFPFGQCRPKHVIFAGIPTQVNWTLEARDRYSEPDEYDRESAD